MTNRIDYKSARESGHVAPAKVPSKFRFPEPDRLKAGLISVLDAVDIRANDLMIIDRQANEYKSTFPMEIVTCRGSDGRPLRLLCKYEAGRGHNGHGHRAGVAYEAEIYRRILQPLAVSTPRFFGTFGDASIGGCCMVLEYLQDSVGLRQLSMPQNALKKAASWIANFHAISEKQLQNLSEPFLISYDIRYYQGWIRRTLEYSENFYSIYPWLPTLCCHAIEIVPNLLATSRTIIHGEYYPDNISVRTDIVSPVDWESAAIGAGEIDLAMLTERWPKIQVGECEVEYRRVRWPRGADPQFERRLAAARLYVQFRWLGDRPKKTLKRKKRFEVLRSLGIQLGLL